MNARNTQHPKRTCTFLKHVVGYTQQWQREKRKHKLGSESPKSGKVNTCAKGFQSVILGSAKPKAREESDW